MILQKLLRRRLGKKGMTDFADYMIAFFLVVLFYVLIGGALKVITDSADDNLVAASNTWEDGNNFLNMLYSSVEGSNINYYQVFIDSEFKNLSNDVLRDEIKSKLETHFNKIYGEDKWAISLCYYTETLGGGDSIYCKPYFDVNPNVFTSIDLENNPSDANKLKSNEEIIFYDYKNTVFELSYMVLK